MIMVVSKIMTPKVIMTILVLIFAIFLAIKYGMPAATVAPSGSPAAP